MWTACLTPSGKGIYRQESPADTFGEHRGETQDLFNVSASFEDPTVIAMRGFDEFHDPFGFFLQTDARLA